MFQHKEAAQEVFAGLRALVRPDDEESLLRISIIEGRFDGNDNAYAMNVGPNYINIRRHFGLSDDATGERYLFNRSFLRISPRTLEHLNHFKRLYRRFGVYKLMPAVVSANLLTPFDELRILKYDLILRKQSDVRPDDDEDALALKENSPKL
ncbi:MAG TPA: hypothetical protein VGY91_01130 [Chthoniobacterales bacterium]|jgi:hypothetical protein|nr:hypothetical protein [Chthoniobacterales bacterium]